MDAILSLSPPTSWERFRSSPLLFIARLLYRPQTTNNPVHHSHKIRIVCISDTHNTHLSQPSLPDGDILIHAGDLTVSGTQHEHDNVLSWLESQPHTHKFFIAGNHDTFLATTDISQYISSVYPSLTYLQETSVQVTIRGRTLCIYGSPYTPQHGSWSTQIWSRIPPHTDILITHGPPLAHLDNDLNLNLDKSAAGCYALLTALWRIRPKLHVFGHVHIGRGIELVRWDAAQKAYEEILAGRVGLTGLVSLVWYKVSAWFWGGSLGMGDTTLMVNAASLGGFKDDLKRGAITVDI